MAKNLTLANKPIIVKTVNNLLTFAVLNNASDIHFDFAERGLTVRYRLWGELGKPLFIPTQLADGVRQRLRQLAGLTQANDEGVFNQYDEQTKIKFQAASAATANGEKIILRLVNAGAAPLAVEHLGISRQQWSALKPLLAAPGLIIICGPDASGTTTTAYSLLESINRPELNICTLENPVEKNILHLNQLAINNKVGLDWAAGWRTLTRQDADVIYLSELPTSVNPREIIAAASGKSIILTLPTATLSGALAYWLDNDFKNLALASLKAVINQRLTRCLCPHCREARPLNTGALSELQEKFDLLGDDLVGLNLYQSHGCRHCDYSGYLGQLGLFELLLPSSQLKDCLATKGLNARARELINELLEVSLVEDGFLKALNGITTIEELKRVI